MTCEAPVANVNIITLKQEEVERGADVGIRRHIYCIMNDLVRDPRDSWTRQIEGALGELAVAKRLGLDWDGDVGDFSKSDVGPYQVRTRQFNTARKHMDLGVKPTDKDGKVFILVLASCPVFGCRGWIMSEDAKKPEWLNSNGYEKVYFVPRKNLNPMSTLPILP